jgi:hypothetical protein
MYDAAALVEQALPSIIEGLKAELKQSLTYEVRSQATQVVAAHVTAWVTENVLPELTAALVESKDGLVALGPVLAEGMVAEMAKSMSAALAAKLTNSWDRKKIFEACFG